MGIPFKEHRTRIRRQPKVVSVSDRLEMMTQEMDAGTCLPTAIQLRQELGASFSTISLALGNLEARGIVERRNGVGVFVAPKPAPAVALLCDPSFLESGSQSPLWGSLVKGLRKRAEAKNESLEFQFSRVAGPRRPPVSPAFITAFKEKRVQGVLALGMHIETMRWLRENGIPAVGFACWGDEHCHLIDYDLTDGFSRQGAEILKENGCERVEVWRPIVMWQWTQYPDCVESWRRNSIHGKEVFNQNFKKSGFRSAPFRFLQQLLEAGAKPLSHQEQGYEMALQCFSQPRSKWPQGLLICDDLVAHGVLMALHQLGVQPKEDVVLVSQANAGSLVLERDSREIIRLEFDPQNVVELMFEELEALMRGELRLPRAQYVAAKLCGYS